MGQQKVEDLVSLMGASDETIKGLAAKITSNGSELSEEETSKLNSLVKLMNLLDLENDKIKSSGGTDGGNIDDAETENEDFVEIREELDEHDNITSAVIRPAKTLVAETVNNNVSTGNITGTKEERSSDFPGVDTRGKLDGKNEETIKDELAPQTKISSLKIENANQKIDEDDDDDTEKQIKELLQEMYITDEKLNQESSNKNDEKKKLLTDFEMNLKAKMFRNTRAANAKKEEEEILSKDKKDKIIQENNLNNKHVTSVEKNLEEIETQSSPSIPENALLELELIATEELADSMNQFENEEEDSSFKYADDEEWDFDFDEDDDVDDDDDYDYEFFKNDSNADNMLWSQINALRGAKIKDESSSNSKANAVSSDSIEEVLFTKEPDTNKVPKKSNLKQPSETKESDPKKQKKAVSFAGNLQIKEIENISSELKNYNYELNENNESYSYGFVDDNNSSDISFHNMLWNQINTLHNNNSFKNEPDSDVIDVPSDIGSRNIDLSNGVHTPAFKIPSSESSSFKSGSQEKVKAASSAVNFQIKEVENLDAAKLNDNDDHKEPRISKFRQARLVNHNKHDKNNNHDKVADHKIIAESSEPETPILEHVVERPIVEDPKLMENLNNHHQVEEYYGLNNGNSTTAHKTKDAKKQSRFKQSKNMKAEAMSGFRNQELNDFIPTQLRAENKIPILDGKYEEQFQDEEKSKVSAFKQESLNNKINNNNSIPELKLGNISKFSKNMNSLKQPSLKQKQVSQKTNNTISVPAVEPEWKKNEKSEEDTHGKGQLKKVGPNRPGASNSKTNYVTTDVVEVIEPPLNYSMLQDDMDAMAKAYVSGMYDDDIKVDGEVIEKMEDFEKVNKIIEKNERRPIKKESEENKSDEIYYNDDDQDKVEPELDEDDEDAEVMVDQILEHEFSDHDDEIDEDLSLTQDFLAQEVSIEYSKLRTKMIMEKNQNFKKSKDEEQFIPIDEMGNDLKISRFRSARLVLKDDIAKNTKNTGNN